MCFVALSVYFPLLSAAFVVFLLLSFTVVFRPVVALSLCWWTRLVYYMSVVGGSGCFIVTMFLGAFVVVVDDVVVTLFPIGFGVGDCCRRRWGPAATTDSSAATANTVAIVETVGRKV